jgi:hypothetical protein
MEGVFTVWSHQRTSFRSARASETREHGLAAAKRRLDSRRFTQAHTKRRTNA